MAGRREKRLLTRSQLVGVQKRKKRCCERVGEDLDVVARALTARCAAGFYGEAGLDVLFDLDGVSDRDARRVRYGKLACVARVPARKKTTSRTKGKFQGWTACAMAVRAAATSPPGVSDFFEYARYTSSSVAGTAMMGFILFAVYRASNAKQSVNRGKTFT
jgi:hypothetical protein